MTKFSTLAVVYAMVLAFATGSASARPAYAAATGMVCGYCHIDPNGGGPLTPAGQYYLAHGTLPPPAPAAPTGLSATPMSSTRIDLAWTDASSNETGFKVERSLSASGPFTQIATPTAAAYSDTGLIASTTYYYRVCSYNDGGNSAYITASATTSAPPPVIPAAPTGLSATAMSSTRIDLAWTDASSNETGFRVERASSASGPFTEIATPTAAAYSNTGLTASTPYYYRVCSYNTAGNSAYITASATTSAPPPVIPAAPTGLSATVVSASQIDLGWTDASSDESGFKVQRASSAAGPFTEIATVAAGVTTYSNTDLSASTPYYYRVCSYNTAGNSAYVTASATTSAPTPVIPAAPTDLSATTVSVSQINLKWTDASSGETGFKVDMSSNPAGPFTEIATVAAGVTTYSSTDLSSSTTYYYRVCSYNTAGDSGYSNTASAATSDPPTVVPEAPTDLSATAVSASQINLKWTDASSDESGFKIDSASSLGGPFTEIATVAAGVTTYSNTDLSASTPYYYRVCAYNTAGDSTYVTASATTSGPTPVIPAAPTGLSASAVSSSQIELRWTDASSNETGFRVQRTSRRWGRFITIATLGAGVTSYADRNLAAGTTYRYRVCSYNAGGNSGYSNAASAVTSRRGSGDDDGGDGDHRGAESNSRFVRPEVQTTP